MVTNEIRNSLKQALTELRIAEFELNRPNEDVVTMSVCYSARNSLNLFLQLYLTSNNIDFKNGNSLTDLLNQCIKLDSNFSKIDISSILCNDLNHKECDGKYCMSVNKVSDCLNLANQVKTLVFEKLKVNESELN